MNGRLVESISFLINEQRYRVRPDKRGKFKIPVLKTVSGIEKRVDRWMFPKEVAEYDEIKSGDPVLTLKNGDKIRVYQGGDCRQMIAEADSIMYLHEREYRSKHKQETKKKKEPKQYGFESLYDGISPYGDTDDW